jgi:hypothetical protein
MVEGVWPLVRDDDWCGEWRALARSAVARVRFTPRTVEVSSAAPASTTTSAPNVVPLTVAGD